MGGHISSLPIAVLGLLAAMSFVYGLLYIPVLRKLGVTSRLFRRSAVAGAVTAGAQLAMFVAVMLVLPDNPWNILLVFVATALAVALFLHKVLIVTLAEAYLWAGGVAIVGTMSLLYGGFYIALITGNVNWTDSPAPQDVLTLVVTNSTIHIGGDSSQQIDGLLRVVEDHITHTGRFVLVACPSASTGRIAEVMDDLNSRGAVQVSLAAPVGSRRYERLCGAEDLRDD